MVNQQRDSEPEPPRAARRGPRRTAERLPPGVRKKQRRDGSWFYEVRWTDAAGQRHSRSFPTADSAIDYHEVQQRSLRRGGTADPSGGYTLFRDFAREWWRERVDSGEVRPSTAAQNDYYLKNHTVPVFGDMRLSDITRNHVRDYLRDLRASGLAASTVAKHFQLLNMILNEAVAEGCLHENPTATIKRPKVVEKPRRFIDPSEFLAIEHCIAPWWQLAVPFMADTALRVGEVAAVTVSDISVDVDLAGARQQMTAQDAVKHLGRITGATVSVGGTVVEVPVRVSGGDRRLSVNRPKTAAGSRTVPTISRSVAVRIVEQVRDRALAPGDWLFGGPGGGQMSPGNWRARVWRPAVRAAAVAKPFPTPHAARHGAVSIWISGGITEPLMIAAYAGHRSVQTVYRIYGHLLPHDSQAARDKLDEIRSSARRAAQPNLAVLPDGDRRGPESKTTRRAQSSGS